VGMTRAESQLVLTGAARRRIFGEYQSTQASRFLDEIPAGLVERIDLGSGSRLHPGDFSHAHYEFRTNPYGRKGRVGRFKEEGASYAYENEDQSAPDLRPGMRVRHPQFGVGTVLSVEAHNDDLKITVRFNSVGSKKLLAKFAKLEPA
jgi:DNA helicase II / ATP-dependent DNA helicase PcrA